MSSDPTRRYVLISGDTHGGGSIDAYKPYLESRWHEEFDQWAATFSDAWGLLDDESDERRIGVSSFGSPVNWESDRRLADLEGEGIAAEVIFPNTVPPFYPSGVISAAGPRTPEEYERRWAGVRAHNRWLVDFCNAVPGRRAGMAQILMNDIDDAVAEIRWASENGLRGILLPSDHVLLMQNLYYPRLDALWQVCEELNMPVHRHATLPTESASPETGDAAQAIGRLEAHYFNRRGLTHLLLSGVFERFPSLTFVTTETMTSWVPSTLDSLDQFCDNAMTDGTITATLGRDAVQKLSKKPSEYYATNCYVASFLAKADIDGRHEVGVDRIMWGSDYPHHEGTWPYTTKALRANFADVPEPEVRSITSLTAAEIYRFDLNLLQGVADRIGPTPSEVAVPLDESELPDDSMCPSLVVDTWG